MPTNRELTQAVAKEFNVSERKMRLIMGKINPEATAHPSSQVKAFTLKKVLRNIPSALRGSGIKMRGLNKRDDILRRKIRQGVDKIDTEAVEIKADKPKTKESTVDYLKRIRNPKGNSETTQNTAQTSGSALARQAETKPPAEARNERQPVKPMHVELAPGIEKIESAGRGEGEPLAPDIG